MLCIICITLKHVPMIIFILDKHCMLYWTFLTKGYLMMLCSNIYRHIQFCLDFKDAENKLKVMFTIRMADHDSFILNSKNNVYLKYFFIEEFGWENIPLFEENIPLFEENIPLFEENIPLFEENIPLFEENIPLFEENIPLFEENIPLFEENIPLFSSASRKAAELF